MLFTSLHFSLFSFSFLFFFEEKRKKEKKRKRETYKERRQNEEGSDLSRVEYSRQTGKSYVRLSILTLKRETRVK